MRRVGVKMRMMMRMKMRMLELGGDEIFFMDWALAYGTGLHGLGVLLQGIGLRKA
jgi:hypothetical protein